MLKSVVCSLVLVFAAIAPAVARADPIETKPFDLTADNEQVWQIILTNKKGSSARLINYGAIVTNLFIPDKDGKLGDVVLGYDTTKQYAESGPFMGCIAGRFANRIAKGMFKIDGIQYAIPINNGPNALHGGFKGLAKRMWNFDTGVTPDGPTVRFTILDPDGAEGFPGNLNVTVLYTLTQNDALKVQYYAHTDKATPINLTHHSYFNLTDGGKSDVLGYVAKITAAHYLPVDATLIPTGEVASVTGTVFDFTKAKLIGRDIKNAPGTPPGYDHSMVLDSSNGDLAMAARIYDPKSGRQLECWTTEPVVHFFTGNNLAGVAGKNGETYAAYRAFCLETQHYPDSPNHPEFPNTILRPGEVYRQITEFRFSEPAAPIVPE
jgi:aldose 1-epimerase